MNEVIYSVNSRRSSVQSLREDENLDILSNFSNFEFEIAHEAQDHNHARKVSNPNLAALDKLKLNRCPSGIQTKILRPQLNCTCGMRQTNTNQFNGQIRCDTYCNKTSARRQRRLITMLVEKQLSSSKNPHDANAILPPSNAGLLNEKKFIVNAGWWCQWCDYVNFTNSSSALDISRGSVFPGRRISEEEVTFYEKPGKICNLKLLDKNARLLSNLVEHYDFVVVDQEIWKHLSSWYEFDH